jgi:hypothetical protein
MNLKRISSVTTYFRKKIIPLILLINILLILFWVSFFNYKFKNLFLIIGPTLIFSYAWISSFRKLKVVYLGNKFLKVDDEKILFEKIISIEKISPLCYKVVYEQDFTVKSFVFMIDTIPPLVPYYIKEIRGIIEEKKQTNYKFLT